MSVFTHVALAALPVGVAPDTSQIRLLPRVEGGSMIHVELAGGAVSKAIMHRSVEELWYILEGCGEMWLKQGEREKSVPLAPGDSLSIPVGTRFQFRSIGSAPLRAVVVTMPPWPGEDEAVFVEGFW